MKTNSSHINPNRIAILGAGESGVGTAILAKAKGYDVFVSDFGEVKENYVAVLSENKIDWEQGGHDDEKIMNATIVMKSPGIPDKAPIVQKLKQAQIKIVSEIEFAAQYTDATIIGITGSNGKTTTTTLCYEILRNEGCNVGLGGNIGQSFAYQVATTDRDYYVLELSSFQLDDCITFRPNVAVLMNITPDHLDRYEYKLENYVASKFSITKNQTADDLFIYCADDRTIQEYINTNKINAQMLPFSIESEVTEGGFATDEQLT
ncbi:MAG: Mur ligase family protein, partial [Chitinophagales bacterium]